MAQSSEKFGFKWNDFQQNIVGCFQELRSDTEFNDITLACEENQQIKAHKIILTACSPFFKTILAGNTHPHPLIYMKGLKVCDLVAILDFIYLGEANIFQEDLDGFLALAEELQLKGLTSSPSEYFDEKEETPKKKPHAPRPTFRKTPKNKLEPHSSPSRDLHKNELFDGNSIKSPNYNPIVPSEYEAMNVGELSKEDLNAKIMSLIERVNDGICNFKCTVCGKTTKVGSRAQDMRRHIETHLEGASYPCNQCGKVSRSSHALESHVTALHRK